MTGAGASLPQLGITGAHTVGFVDVFRDYKMNFRGILFFYSSAESAVIILADWRVGEVNTSRVIILKEW